jgi:hypothetical protein
MDLDYGDDPPEEPGQSELELKTEILAAIAEHLRLHGPRNWKLVRERPEFSSVIGERAGEAGRRKFYRWQRSVREPMAADKTRPHDGRGVADEALADASDRARTAAERHLPAAPSPAFFMKMGAGAEVKVNLVGAIDQVWADLMLVREHAFDDDGSGGLRLKSPKVLVESARSRLAAMDTVMRLIRDIYDLNALHRRYRSLSDIIIDELASAPDIQARVLDRLEALNNAEVMTPFAEAR